MQIREEDLRSTGIAGGEAQPSHTPRARGKELHAWKQRCLQCLDLRSAPELFELVDAKDPQTGTTSRYCVLLRNFI